MASSKTSEKKIEIPGYTVLKRLGRGGMAEVYLAVQESIGRKVAIKIMLPALLTDESFSERFLREAKISAKLAHPNIVSIFDVGVVDNLHYITMGYLPGGDLKDRIKKGMPLGEAVRTMKEIATALDFAHKAGFVHRDIKPENILFSQTGHAVLSDFGIARASEGVTSLTVTGSIVGTPHYMSPEQAQGKKVDGRSDLYSLGIVFYQMLSGRVPFEGDSAMSIGIKHIRDPIPDLPPQFAKYQTFLNKLLAKEPADRWQTGADVARTLEVLDADGDLQGSDTMASTMVSADAVQATQITGATGSQAPAAKRTGLVIGVVAGALLAIGGYVAQQQGLFNSKPPVAENSPALEGKVQRLLAEANQALAAGNYFEPRNESAYQKYQAVLAIDGGNQAAKDGLRSISNHYIKEARAAVDASNFPDATRRLKLATEADASNPEVAIASAELKAGEAAFKRAKASVPKSAPTVKVKAAPAPSKLDGYLAEASGYLSPSQMSEARLERATQLYRSAYQLAPRDPQVRQLSEQIATGYQLLADDKRTQKSWDAARQLANKGLVVAPGHSGLKQLIAKIDSDKAAESQPSSGRRAFGGF